MAPSAERKSFDTELSTKRKVSVKPAHAWMVFEERKGHMGAAPMSTLGGYTGLREESSWVRFLASKAE